MIICSLFWPPKDYEGDRSWIATVTWWNTRKRFPWKAWNLCKSSWDNLSPHFPHHHSPYDCFRHPVRDFPNFGGEMHVYDRFQWPASVSKLARINKIPTDTRRLALIPTFSHRLLHLCWGFQSSEAWRSGPPSVSSCDWQDLRGVPIQHAWKRYGDPKCVRQGGAHGAGYVGTQHWQGRYMGSHADQRRNISSIPGMRPT